MPGTRRCNQNRRTATGPLPGAPFRLRRIVTRRSVCQRIWPELTGGDDLSFPRYDCLSPGHHSRIETPGLPLPSAACPSPETVDRPLPCPRRFAPAQGRDHDDRPAFPVETGASSRASVLHSPSRTFVRSGSKRSTRFAAGKLTFRNRPIALRSPQPLLIE